MKEYKDFIPKDDPSLMRWLHNYKMRFPELASKIPKLISNPLFPEQEKLAQELQEALQDVERKKAEFAGAVALKEHLKAKNLRLIRDMGIIIKRSEHYDESIGAALGIIYKGYHVDNSEVVSQIKATAHQDFVQINFTKRNALGACIFGRYEGGEWELLGKQKRSPFLDKRPSRIPRQPERREYMVRLWDGEKMVGQESDILSVVFGGG